MESSLHMLLDGVIQITWLETLRGPLFCDVGYTLSVILMRLEIE
jgi:hypothetical protein